MRFLLLALIIASTTSWASAQEEAVPLLNSSAEAPVPLAVAVQDPEVLAAQINTRYEELKVLVATGNQLKFNQRFGEIQRELHSLVGTRVVWPAEVVEVRDERPEPKYPRPNRNGVHLQYLAIVGELHLSVQFGPSDGYGNHLLRYDTQISRKYAGTLDKGDVIQVRGTIRTCEFNPDDPMLHFNCGRGWFPLILDKMTAVEPK